MSTGAWYLLGPGNMSTTDKPNGVAPDRVATKLDARRVREIMEDSLFKDDEDLTGMVEVQGVLNRFGFHPDRLKGHATEIAGMLLELPDEFYHSKGGGMSFLQACMDRHGNHWAEHRTMDQLFALGIGIGKAKCLVPREMWNLLPGGMPYFVVLDRATENQL